MQWTGATLAQEAINRNGGVDIDGVSYILELVPIETGEETVDPSGLTGVSDLTAAITTWTSFSAVSDQKPLRSIEMWLWRRG